MDIVFIEIYFRSCFVILKLFKVLNSDTVVMEWASGIFGMWSIVFSFLVTLSAMGSCVGTNFGGMRQLVCISREGKSQIDT